MSLLRVRHLHALVGSRCHSSHAAHAAAEKLRTHLQPRIAEEAQLLAEMNVPVAEQSSIAEQMGRQDAAIAQCARARALQQAERDRRDAWRMQRDLERASGHMSIEPLSLNIDLPQDLDRRIQERTAAAVAQIAQSNLKLQMMSDRLNATEMRFAGFESSARESGDQAVQHALQHVRCKIKAAQEVHAAAAKAQCSSAPE